VVEQFRSKEIRSAKLTGSATPPSELLASFVEEKVGTDKVWILLDALDEVESDLRGEAIDKVTDFIDANPNSRLLLTSRPVPYDNGLTRKLDRNKTERELKLRRFEKDQVEEFAEEYFESKDVDEFLSRLDGVHALQKMTEVPLFLSFLCMIYEEEGLPDFHSRAEVCRKILKEMLSTGGHKPQKHGFSSPMERDERLDELGAMAFSLKAQGKSEFTPKGLREAIEFGYRKVYGQKPRPEDVSERRRKYVDELGILSGSNQKYRFVHLTIREYLSAKWIKKEIDEKGGDADVKIEDVDGDKRRASTFMRPTNSDPEHVAFLAEMLDDPDPLLDLLSKQLESGTKDEQEAAAKTLGRIGNFNSLALEGLVDRLGAENWSTRRAATMALGEIDSSDQLGFQVGETSVRDALIDKLRDTRWSVREAAAKVIGKIDHSEKVIRPLRDRLADSKWPVRRAAAKALGRIETSSPKAIEDLIGCLGDEKESVRKESRKSLELLKEVALKEVQQAIIEDLPASRSAAAFITSLLGDERKGFLSAAARALKQTEAPVLETVAKDLARRLGEESESARNLAAQGLTEIVTTAPEAMETLGLESAKALRDRLGDGTPVSVRRAVALAIAQVRGSELKEAQDTEVVQGLISCLEEFDLRPEAAKALGRASITDTEVSEELTQWLAEDERPDTRATVAEALGQIGVFSSQVVEGLVERLEDESANVIKKASRSLQKVESLSEETIDNLTSLLRNKNKDTGTAAADVLWAAGEKGKMALILQLDSTSLRARRTAERVLEPAAPQRPRPRRRRGRDRQPLGHVEDQPSNPKSGKHGPRRRKVPLDQRPHQVVHRQGHPPAL